MATCVDEVNTKMSKNTAKKMCKRLRKIEANLSEKENIVISSEATKLVCIQNGGLGNGVGQEELLPLILSFGEIDGIIMIPRKSYCFVSFKDVSASKHAVNALNGHLLRKGLVSAHDVVLYLFFVSSVPMAVLPSNEKPPGLIVIENFVDEETETILLKLMEIDKAIGDIGECASLKHRKVKHFGYEFKYRINDVDIHEPLEQGIPDACNIFLQKALNEGLVQYMPDQLTINQYQPGQGIPPHIDTIHAFEDGIMSLSLGSQTVMEFRHPNGNHLSVLLPQRSLLVMTGDSRYTWSHGITPRKADIVPCTETSGLTLVNRSTRTSFTFRKVILDRRIAEEKKRLPRSESEALALEREYVHEVYSDIAEHFSGTRYKPWPKVVEFLYSRPSFSFLADVGCGNGKCLGLTKSGFEVGSDYSCQLAEICCSKGFPTCIADVTNLPFRSAMFDVVLCVAVIHHMSTEERRLKALYEIVRILRKNGQALIYVWALEQRKNNTTSTYINTNKQKKMDEKNTFDYCIADKENLDTNHESNLSETHLDPSIEQNENSNYSSISKNDETGRTGTLKVHVNRTEFKDQDLLVPWQLKTQDTSMSTPKVFHRFYHLFIEGEIEKLCSFVPGCQVKHSYYDQGNWCVILEKIK